MRIYIFSRNKHSRKQKPTAKSVQKLDKETLELKMQNYKTGKPLL